MPRAFSPSRGYLPPMPAEEDAERARLAGGDPSTMEPLTTTPDFASITWLASKLQLYGEAHPSSTALKGAAFIGQGATFSVYRSRSYRGVVRAIKQPRLVFEYKQDETRTMQQLYSLHLELRVLTDQRIRAHGNIAKLVSIAWEEHADDLGQLWPSLVMEHAAMGTLSACYHRGLNIGAGDQRKLCFAIGDALRHLHLNGVIHGDIKPENVLMFRDEESKTFIPKLSDFGYSVLDGENSPGLPRGTPYWEAPEVLEGERSRELLPLSDTYSFGLLAWYIASGGKDPLESLSEVPAPFDGNEAQKAIRRLKLTASVSNIATQTLPADGSFYSIVFELTLAKNPTSRDLHGVLSHLKQTGGAPPSSHNEPQAPHHGAAHNSASRFSLRELRHLGTGIQIQILDSLESRASKRKLSSRQDDVKHAEAAFAVARCCLESMGGRKPADAVDWLIRAARLGHSAAKALVYRVSASLGLFEKRQDEVLAFLKESSEDGIVIAIHDLCFIDKTSGEEVLQKIWTRRREQCVGSISLERDLPGLLGGLTIADEEGSLLHKAARCGDLPLMEKLLQSEGGAVGYLNLQDNNGQTPLLQACMARDSSTIKLLLNRGADASIPDRLGDTPLHWLFFFDEDPSVDDLAARLIEGGGDVNAQTTKEGWDTSSFKELSAGTPLHRAAAWNSSKAVIALLRREANPLLPSKRSEITTPLWLACTYHSGRALLDMLDHLKSKGSLDIGSILNGNWPLLMPVLDQGYYYRTGGTLGRIARHGASFRESTADTIIALKRHGASMMLPNGTPAISQAILLRCLDIVDTVLTLTPEMIEDVDPKRKQPPLHFAVQQDRADILELLLSRGADLRSRNHQTSITALASYANHHAGLEIPRILLRAGLTFEVPPNHYQTPFFSAITRSSFDLAVFILDNTAPSDRHAMINAPAASGPTFRTSPPGITILGYLLSAMHQNTPRLVDRLFRIVHPFNETLDFVVSPGEGRTALHVLAEFGRLDRIDNVVAAVARRVLGSCPGVEVDRGRESDGQTALCVAVASSNYDLASILLEAGPDPNAQDQNMVSPLSLLRKRATPSLLAQEPLEEQDAIQQLVRLLESRGFVV